MSVKCFCNISDNVTAINTAHFLNDDDDDDGDGDDIAVYHMTYVHIDCSCCHSKSVG